MHNCTRIFYPLTFHSIFWQTTLNFPEVWKKYFSSRTFGSFTLCIHKKILNFTTFTLVSSVIRQCIWMKKVVISFTLFTLDRLCVHSHLVLFFLGFINVKGDVHVIIPNLWENFLNLMEVSVIFLSFHFTFCCFFSYLVAGAQ